MQLFGCWWMFLQIVHTSRTVGNRGGVVEVWLTSFCGQVIWQLFPLMTECATVVGRRLLVYADVVEDWDTKAEDDEEQLLEADKRQLEHGFRDMVCLRVRNCKMQRRRENVLVNAPRSVFCLHPPVEFTELRLTGSENDTSQSYRVRWFQVSIWFTMTQHSGPRKGSAVHRTRFFRLGIHLNMSAAHTLPFPEETTRTDQSHDGWCTLQSSRRAHCSFLGHRPDWPSWDVGLHRWSGIARDISHQSPSTLSDTSVCSVVHCSWRDAPASILRNAFCGYTLSRSRVHDRAVFSRQIHSRDGLLCWHRLTFGFDVPKPRWLENCLRCVMHPSTRSSPRPHPSTRQAPHFRCWHWDRDVCIGVWPSPLISLWWNKLTVCHMPWTLVHPRWCALHRLESTQPLGVLNPLTVNDSFWPIV